MDRQGLSVLTRREVLRLAGASALVVACQPTATPQGSPGAKSVGTIRIAIGVDPDTLDPQGQTTTTVQNIVDYVTETLVRYDENGKIQPLLAEKWQAASDGKSYTFSLRKATFHDGTPFNAAAVKKTWERVLNPDLKVPLRSPLGDVVSSVDAVDDQTVRFTLKTPFPPLVAALAGTQYAIVSSETVDKFRATYTEEPVGTGPYRFKERRKGESVTLARYDGYWGKKPAYDTVVIRVVPEAATRESLVLSGQAEVIILPPIADLPNLKSNSAVKVLAGASDRTIFLAFNLSRKAMQDKRVRQAINYAIDKDAIIKNVLFGQAERMDAPVASSIFGYCKVGGYDYDPTKARQLLKDAGAEGLAIKMGYPTGRYVQDKQAGEAIAGFLRDVGLKVDASTSDWPTYLGSINVAPDKSVFDVHLLGWAPGYLDASQQMAQFGGTNFWPPKGLSTSYYDSSAVVDLNAKATSETDEKKRADLYCQLWKTIWDDAPWAFLWVQKFPIVYSAKLKGVTSIPTEKFDALYAEPA